MLESPSKPSAHTSSRIWPRDRTWRGFWARKAKRLNSVGVRSMSSPPRRTVRAPTSTTRSATRSRPSSTPTPVRRSTARIRATSSSMLNGFVT